MKNKLYLLGFLLPLLCPSLAQGEPISPQQYQVEVILFTQAGFNLQANPPKWGRFKFFNTRNALILKAMDSKAEPAKPFQLLPENTSTLGPIRLKLQEGGRKVIAHWIWRQPITGRSKWIILEGGTNYDQFGKPIEATALGSDFSVDGQPYLDTLHSPDTLSFTHSLTAKLSVRQVKDHFLLRVISRFANPIAESKPANLDTPAEHFQSVVMRHKQRVRLDHLTYLDDENFGILVAIKSL